MTPAAIVALGGTKRGHEPKAVAIWRTALYTWGRYRHIGFVLAWCHWSVSFKFGRSTGVFNCPVNSTNQSKPFTSKFPAGWIFADRCSISAGKVVHFTYLPRYVNLSILSPMRNIGARIRRELLYQNNCGGDVSLTGTGLQLLISGFLSSRAIQFVL